METHRRHPIKGQFPLLLDLYAAIKAPRATPSWETTYRINTTCCHLYMAVGKHTDVSLNYSSLSGMTSWSVTVWLEASSEYTAVKQGIQHHTPWHAYGYKLEHYMGSAATYTNGYQAELSQVEAACAVCGCWQHQLTWVLSMWSQEYHWPHSWGYPCPYILFISVNSLARSTSVNTHAQGG